MVSQLIHFTYHYGSASEFELGRGVTLNKAGEPGSHVKLQEQVEINGKIKQIVVHFPPGCAGLVGIRLFLGTKQLLPRSGYLALDNAVMVMNFNYDVKYGDLLMLEAINTDYANPHFVSVTLLVEGE